MYYALRKQGTSLTRRGILWGSAAAGSAAMLRGVRPACAQDSPPWTTIVEAANREGRVVLYTQTVPALNERLKRDFEKAYPGIRLEISRIVGPTAYTKLEQEQASGADGGDLSMHSDLLWFVDTASRSGFQKPSGPAARTWPAKYLIGGCAPVFGVEPVVMAYNTKLAPFEITGYRDLLRPELKGKVGLQDLVTAGIAAWYDWLEATQGADFLPALAAQGSLIASAVQNTQGVAAGELAVAPVTILSIVRPLIAQGAPVKAVLPNPGFGSAYAAALVSWAKRPNAGLVFLDYLISTRGQTAMVADGEMASPLANIPGSLNIDAIDRYDPAKYTAQFVSTYRAKWNRIFHPQ